MLNFRGVSRQCTRAIKEMHDEKGRRPEIYILSWEPRRFGDGERMKKQWWQQIIKIMHFKDIIRTGVCRVPTGWQMLRFNSIHVIWFARQPHNCASEHERMGEKGCIKSHWRHRTTPDNKCFRCFFKPTTRLFSHKFKDSLTSNVTLKRGMQWNFVVSKNKVSIRGRLPSPFKLDSSGWPGDRQLFIWIIPSCCTINLTLFLRRQRKSSPPASRFSIDLHRQYIPNS